ncbi:Gfo/Idh/MocA family oxidoreductase [Streptomyces virginiae]|uniref:Gfo/Idh/MocA family oxidoreductase n=1 Tax=Streptomyces virginiae TaxID=1961 RepID=UPI0035DB7E7E
MRDEGVRIHALYRDVRPGARIRDPQAWEEFELKRDPFEPPDGAPDLVIVATPDTAHAGVLRAAAAEGAVVIVEKPFTVTVAEAARTRDLPGLVLGVDHFPAYISEAASHAEQIWDHLGGAVESVRFVLLQRTPVEPDRLASLSTGLTFDMLPHFLALLVSLGLTGPVKDSVLLGAGRHVPLTAAGPGDGPRHPDGSARRSRRGDPEPPAYRAETWSETGFTLAGTSDRPAVLCTGLVGKGFPVDARFLELTAPSGAAVRLDLGSPSWQHPGYPGGAVALLGPPRPHDRSTKLLPDPALFTAVGPRLVTTRPYDAVIAQLAGHPATPRAASCLFGVEECEWMMSVLEPLGTAARQLAAGTSRTDHDLGGYPVRDDGRVWC